MATNAEIESLKRITDGAEGYTDGELSELLDSGLTEREVAYKIWTEKSAATSKLVDMSESGSSRSLSQAHKNALAMAAFFSPEATLEATIAPPKRTRRMVRG